MIRYYVYDKCSDTYSPLYARKDGAEHDLECDITCKWSTNAKIFDCEVSRKPRRATGGRPKNHVTKELIREWVLCWNDRYDLRLHYDFPAGAYIISDYYTGKEIIDAKGPKECMQMLEVLEIAYKAGLDAEK
jgi:hypothetical protein